MDTGQSEKLTRDFSLGELKRGREKKTYGSFIGIIEVDFNDNFKFTPASLCDFIRGLHNH